MPPAPNQDLIVTIERQEGRFFIISLPDKQQITIPIYHFSKQARIGDKIHLRFLTEKEAKAEKTEMARVLLEEILNGS